jgi:hypothetical protein
MVHSGPAEILDSGRQTGQKDRRRLVQILKHVFYAFEPVKK